MTIIANFLMIIRARVLRTALGWSWVCTLAGDSPGPATRVSVASTVSYNGNALWKPRQTRIHCTIEIQADTDTKKYTMHCGNPGRHEYNAL